jgi:hypothetical protein
MKVSSYDSLWDGGQPGGESRRAPTARTRSLAAFGARSGTTLRATRPTNDTGPTIIAVLDDGPLAGREVDAAVVEGRPPKTIDVPADDGTTCRYCLVEWNQSGPSAQYEFLYVV